MNILRGMRVAEMLKIAKPFGWIFENATFVAATVRLDPKRARRWLPPGLALAKPERARLFVAHYPATTFGSVYNEAGLFVDVRRVFLRGVHCPWMLVDDDVALILGRDALGYPKKIGDFDLSLGGETISATVQRKGIKILGFEGTVGPIVEPPRPMLGQRTYNAWGGLGLLPQRLICFTPREEIIEVRRVELTMQIHAAVLDPLDDLGVQDVIEAHRYRVNIGGGFPPRSVRHIGPAFSLRNYIPRVW